MYFIKFTLKQIDKKALNRSESPAVNNFAYHLTKHVKEILGAFFYAKLFDHEDWKNTFRNFSLYYHWNVPSKNCS